MGKPGGWNSQAGILTNLLDGNVIAIVLAVFITFSVPLLLHYIFYRRVVSPGCSNFLLLGPSGAGKTALFSLLEAKTSHLSKRTSQLTHTSQTSTVATIALPPSIPTASNRYRSVNDPSLKEISRNPIKYRLKDTPGHGKLRESQGLSQLLLMSKSKEPNTRLRGVIFVVDTAALSEDEALRDTASYLHDVLLILQKRALNRGKSSSKLATEIPVLVAANKQDLFTALPPGSVREKLQAEIDRIRKTKSKGLMDAGAVDTEEDILGNDDGLDNFSFKLLEDEVGVTVDVIGGAVKEDNKEDLGSGVQKWEEWIGMCL
ncbi:hypothetical protein MPDQ_004193 [Monascus purpureus]|uniref:Signal recognition particle receptor subunit beta n=1 Tax=Monascus purpureus TaxID=5098 RepID=A0A507QLK0_MONPU|nr:hypothetical protein MPDQ_004193 [Monascus purpureus]BDD60549.1 hypothetical protein MAP00_005672 [Monascus purpureus]